MRTEYVKCSGSSREKYSRYHPLKSAVKGAPCQTVYSADILEMDGQDVLFRIACEGRDLCT